MKKLGRKIIIAIGTSEGTETNLSVTRVGGVTRETVDGTGTSVDGRSTIFFGGRRSSCICSQVLYIS